LAGGRNASVNDQQPPFNHVVYGKATLAGSNIAGRKKAARAAARSGACRGAAAKRLDGRVRQAGDEQRKCYIRLWYRRARARHLYTS